MPQNQQIAERKQGAAIARKAYIRDKINFISKSEQEYMEVITMKFDLSSIMRHAWDIYNAALDGSDIKPLFSICLQMAWEDARNETQRVIDSWESLPVERQIGWLRASVKRAAKDEIAYSTEDNYNQFVESPAWFLFNHGLDEFVNEAWLKLQVYLDPVRLAARNERRHAAGKLNVSLYSLVYQAAVHGINKVWRDDVKHIRAQQKTKRDKNGTEYSYIETMATNRRDSTEVQAIGHLALEEFESGRDELDKMIIEGLRDSYKKKEIAVMAGVTPAAITKRLKKLREALREAGMAPTWLAA